MNAFKSHGVAEISLRVVAPIRPNLKSWSQWEIFTDLSAELPFAAPPHPWWPFQLLLCVPK